MTTTSIRGLSRDAALVAAAQANPAAFAALYELYYPPLYRFAQRQTRNPVQAEDVVAETFLFAFKALPQYEWRERPFAAWLYRIATNVITAQYQRNGRIVQLPLDGVLSHLFQMASDEPGPAAWLEAQEHHQAERARLQRALDRLTPDQRRAVLLRYGGLDVVPLAEVARRMARSEGAVKLLLHRAVATLRRVLTDPAAGREM
jgi:RNA polymerase sigma-70 factor (ECF subfamily)